MLGYLIFWEVTMLFLVTVVNTNTEAVVQRRSYYKFCKTEYKDLLFKNISEIDQTTTVVPDWLCLIDKENIKFLVTQKLPSAAVLQKSFSEKIRNFWLCLSFHDILPLRGNTFKAVARTLASIQNGELCDNS